MNPSIGVPREWGSLADEGSARKVHDLAGSLSGARYVASSARAHQIQLLARRFDYAGSLPDIGKANVSCSITVVKILLSVVVLGDRPSPWQIRCQKVAERAQTFRLLVPLTASSRPSYVASGQRVVRYLFHVCDTLHLAIGLEVSKSSMTVVTVFCSQSPAGRIYQT